MCMYKGIGLLSLLFLFLFFFFPSASSCSSISDDSDPPHCLRRWLAVIDECHPKRHLATLIQY